ncbi:MAG: VacJ family lipoprotein [Alphaproteobacteria bacterium]|nr:VacJ family lipoprotein [Alphaproteobacteria bacterium]
MKKITVLLAFLLSVELAKGNDSDFEQPVANEVNEEISDPLEGYNRAMYEVNWALDRVFIRPVAEGYGFVPGPVRKSVRNFIANLRSPLTFVNNVLQLEPVAAGQTLARTLVNTTIGVGGLFDVATELEMEYHYEGFADTLAFLGVPSGPYIILPILGPSTPRDMLGMGGDVYGNPVNWVLWNQDMRGYVNARDAMYMLDLRTESRGFTDEIEKAIDPYARVRSLYWQSRVMRQDKADDDKQESPRPSDSE